MTTIVGVSLENRLEEAIKFQTILTEFGCNIRTRIGLHPSMESVCLNRGIILLEVYDDSESLLDELRKHWSVQIMIFE